MSKAHPGQSIQYKRKVAIFESRVEEREIHKQVKTEWIDKNKNIKYRRDLVLTMKQNALLKKKT